MNFDSYSAFLFDLDGTLADTMPSHNRSWIEVFNSEGITVDEKEFIQIATGMAGVDIIRHFAYPHATEADIARLGAKRIPIFKSLIHGKLNLLPGCVEFLDKSLAQNKKLAIATSSSLGILDFLVQELNLQKWFSTIISRKEVKRGKPFPDLFLYTAQSLNVPIEQCLVFEDSLAGIQAAETAKMDLCVLKTALTSSELQQLNLTFLRDAQADYTAW